MIPAELAAEVERLAGHKVTTTDSTYLIEDIAREGRPLVGIVERRGDALWLVPTDADEGTPAVKLDGPLAHPRLAGPGYKVWVLGDVKAEALRIRRLGVLRAPR